LNFLSIKQASPGPRGESLLERLDDFENRFDALFFFIILFFFFFFSLSLSLYSDFLFFSSKKHPER
jgi:hypothetical protein